MKNLLVYFLSEIVRHTAHECALREIGYLGRRYQRVQLCVDGSGCVLPVDGNGLPLLEDFTEPFRKAFGSLAYHLAAENVAHRVLDYLRLFFSVVTGQLGEVLETEADRHLVASSRGNQIVDTAKIYRG